MNEEIIRKLYDRKAALEKAKNLSKKHSYVILIQNNKEFFIEIDPCPVRSWEKIVSEWRDGKKTR